MIIKFSVDNPVSINDLQNFGSGRAYNSKKYKEFKENVSMIVNKLIEENNLKEDSDKIEIPLKGELYCKVVFYPRDKRKRDLDNFSFKGLFDALTQAGFIDDDSSFYSLNAIKKKPIVDKDMKKEDKKNKLDVEIGYYEE